MNEPVFYVGASIFDGYKRHEHSALHVSDGEIVRIISHLDIPYGASICQLEAGLLVPGFVDLQVNGGGGVLLNNHPSLATIRKICATHAQFGTTALLTTLITDTPDKTRATIAAAHLAVQEQVPGFLGLHLEGPHLSITRKGAHDPTLIRPMDDRDMITLLQAKQGLKTLMVTIACENVQNHQIRRLSDAGIIVSLGHTNATYESAIRAVQAGVRSVTHLFNAMNPFCSREPGLIGAALQEPGLSASLIADGYHIDPISMDIALRAKRGTGKIFLITDAMSPIGTDLQSFTLNGRKIFRKSGRLTLADGTLAGADLDMISAVRFVVNRLGREVDEALRMASLYPALSIGMEKLYGCFLPGSKANIVHLNHELQVQSVWIEGVPVLNISKFSMI